MWTRTWLPFELFTHDAATLISAIASVGVPNASDLEPQLYNQGCPMQCVSNVIVTCNRKYNEMQPYHAKRHLKTTTNAMCEPCLLKHGQPCVTQIV